MKRSSISRLIGASVLVTATACVPGGDLHERHPAALAPQKGPIAPFVRGPASLEGVTPPVGRLPPEVRPTHVALSLAIGGLVFAWLEKSGGDPFAGVYLFACVIAVVGLLAAARTASPGTPANAA